MSEDEGNSFQLVESLWKHPTRKEVGLAVAAICPVYIPLLLTRVTEDHLHIGISCAGVFETTDAGKSWAIRNKGMNADFLPDPTVETGFDPHIVVARTQQPRYAVAAESLWYFSVVPMPVKTGSM